MESSKITEQKLAKKAGRKPKGRPTGVKQSKIVRQNDRVDPLTGKGRSKGYGFIEMDTHSDALRVLRWCNNNKECNVLLWKWWCEEVLELWEGGKKSLEALRESKSTGLGVAAKTDEGESESESEGSNDEEEEKSKSKSKSKSSSKKASPKDLDSRIEELAARVKKLEARALDIQSRPDNSTSNEATIKDGRSLHVEFSIENITVVKRRNERSGSGGKVRFNVTCVPCPHLLTSPIRIFLSQDSKKRTASIAANDAVPEDDKDARPAKKAKIDKPSKSAKLTKTTPTPTETPNDSEATTLKKKGTSIGSLIGKKRRAKKLGGKK